MESCGHEIVSFYDTIVENNMGASAIFKEYFTMTKANYDGLQSQRARSVILIML